MASYDDTSRIFALRKERKLDQARKLAEDLIHANNFDEKIIQAYAWTLIDICKRSILQENLKQAHADLRIIQNLSTNFFEPMAHCDEFAETLVKSIKRLKSSMDPNYEQIRRAIELSKNNNHDEAYTIFSQLYEKNALSSEHHESYGWTIYRYLNTHAKDLSSRDVRKLLIVYMDLRNERPSMLHSTILNFALKYSELDNNFKFISFLELWGVKYLTPKDYDDSVGRDGRKIPSLMSRISHVVSNYPTSDIVQFLQMLGSDHDQFHQLLQEKYFWKILNSNQEGNKELSLKLLDKYLEIFTEPKASAVHSKVLNLAERTMKEEDAYRFLQFFKGWNPINLRNEDWKEEIGNDGNAYKPLAIKCLKKTKDAIKSLSKEEVGDLQWLIDLYGVATRKFPDDDWNIRSKALLHLRAGQLDEARSIYMDLCTRMGEKYYIWQEFAECWDDNEIRIALLCKAISLEKNEDFIGKIRLALAKQLLTVGQLDAAAVELNLYVQHYTQMGWRIVPEIYNLQAQCGTSTSPRKDNEKLYTEYIHKAEDCAYADIPYSEVVLIDKWTNKEGKEMMTFSVGGTREFVIKKNRFPALRKARIGQVMKMKLLKEETVKKIPFVDYLHPSRIEVSVKYTPLLVTPSETSDWGCLPVGYGYVQHVNTEKKVYHIYTTDSTLVYERYDKQAFQAGNLVSFRQYSKKVKEENKTHIGCIQKCTGKEALDKFPSKIAAVDDVNDQKQLFHLVLGTNLITGILHFNETNLRPSVGDCIKIHYVVRKVTDKQNPNRQKKVLEIINAEATQEVNKEVIREISGHLELKYRDIHNDEADFAFVNNAYYVPKSILQKYSIQENCHIRGRAIYTGGDKWKVFEIERV